jgi:hypothetical protein
MKTTQIVYDGPFPEVTVDSPKYGVFPAKRGESITVPDTLARELASRPDWRVATVEKPEPKGS